MKIRGLGILGMVVVALCYRTAFAESKRCGKYLLPDQISNYNELHQSLARQFDQKLEFYATSTYNKSVAHGESHYSNLRDGESELILDTVPYTDFQAKLLQVLISEGRAYPYLHQTVQETYVKDWNISDLSLYGTQGNHYFFYDVGYYKFDRNQSHLSLHLEPRDQAMVSLYVNWVMENLDRELKAPMTALTTLDQLVTEIENIRQLLKNLNVHPGSSLEFTITPEKKLFISRLNNGYTNEKPWDQEADFLFNRMIENLREHYAPRPWYKKILGSSKPFQNRIVAPQEIGQEAYDRLMKTGK